MPFGNPATYPGHSGIDYPQPSGTPFRASGSGVVTWLGSNARGGNFIWVKYDAIGPKVGYHHMPSHAGCPREGARFNEGDQLGFVGSTGNSTGPHLHSEVEGYASTSGYWQFFDRNRVVGSGGGGGSAGGPSIGAIQGWLNDNLGAGLVQDGIDGPATQAAVKVYQGILGVAQDGIWGAGTEAAHREQHPANHLYGGTWVRIIQDKLNRLGYGTLATDGLDGAGTRAAVSRFQAANGLDADGIAGPATNAVMDQLLAGGGKLTVDGELGPQTIRAMQKAFGVDQDGEWGPATTSAIQKHLGVTVDGDLGPQTIKALQRALKVNADGEIGPETVKALQTWLNAGGYLTPVPDPGDTTTPDPGPEATPRKPTYPGAIRGWNVPLASPRAAGTTVDTLIVHHQASTNDDENYFKSDNSRGSCPTWQVKRDGTVVELIEPSQKPSSTGSWNSRSWAIETQNSSGNPTWGITEESHEAIAKIAAWLHETRGLVLDRQHIIGHNEAGFATACPGPSMNLDKIVARALTLVNEEPEPEPDPDTVPVERSWLQGILDKLKNVLGSK